MEKKLSGSLSHSIIGGGLA